MADPSIDKGRRVRSRKATADERRQVRLLLRADPHVPPRALDLANINSPPIGTWLFAEPPQDEAPDRIIALVNNKITDRFAMVQWNEQGFPVGRITFEPGATACRAVGPVTSGELKQRSRRASLPRGNHSPQLRDGLRQGGGSRAINRGKGNLSEF